MAVPRCLVVQHDVAGIYHCISRCVRRAFLCGNGFDHRRGWIRGRLRELVDLFALDVCGYAVLSNHFHVVVRTSPDRANRWTSEEVARRWLHLFPPPGDARSPRNPLFAGAVAQLAADAERIAVLRSRLADLSWFMRCLKERIARRANHEDECTGRFWEGRFKCHRLLDDAAVLACLAYVDLNVIRAGLARTPEQSEHTSVRDRIRARRHIRRLRSQGRCAATGSAFCLNVLPGLSSGRLPCDDEDGIWLARIDRRDPVAAGEGLLPMTLDEYLQLVDGSGRRLRANKSGVIPSELRPILSRLSLDEGIWGRCMGRVGRMIGTVIGTATSCAREAARRERQRVVSAMSL